jgi:hypothetical protein
MVLENEITLSCAVSLSFAAREQQLWRVQEPVPELVLVNLNCCVEIQTKT